MRKLALAIATLLSLPGAAYAAFAIFQTYNVPSVPQITCNLVTGVASVGGPCTTPVATCNGDAQTITRTITTTAGSNSFVFSTNTFTGADVGKFIQVTNTGFGGNNPTTGTILTVGPFTSTQTITLSSNALTARTSYSTSVLYGSDDAPSFWSFRTWALANQGASNQVVLTIPTGSDCQFMANAGTVGGRLSGVSNTFVAGINNLKIEGTGAILREVVASYWLGSAGFCERGLTDVNGCSARIQSAAPNDSTVTLTTASLSAGYISRFNTGDWIMVGGLDTQGQWLFAIGSPPNQTYFEWRQITNVNAGTGVITLDRPLTKTFLDTWPNYNGGDAGRPDNGGAATIWTVGAGAANGTWNTTAEYIGLTMYHSGQIYAAGRNVTFRNVTFPSGSGLGAIPTQNETFTAIGTTWNAVIEVDKLIGTFTLDSSSLTLLQFQSNSTDLFIARNGTTFSSGLHGGGKRSELTDVTIADFRPGSYAYGNTPGPVICTRCAVASWVNGGISQQDSPTSPYSMSSGVISFPNTAATGGGPAQRWASTIGKTIFYSTGGVSSLGVFTVLGVTQDPTNTYIQTDQAGGFPNFSTAGSSNNLAWFSANGAQQFTCDACTGAASFTAMNIQQGATPLAPMMTYAKQAFTPSSVALQGSLFGIGKLTSLTVDVTTAFVGSGSPTLTPTAQFGNPTINQSTWTQFSWFPTINLKQAGKRVISPGGVTCDTGGGPVGGACLGDTINSTNGFPPNAVWVQNALAVWTAGTFSGMTTPPTFTVTIQTDQTP